MPDYRSHVTFEGAFSVAECERIVEIGDAAASEVATLSGVDSPDAAMRRSKVAWIPQGPASAWIHDALSSYVVQANRTWRFDVDGFGEDLQYTVYDEPGSFYTWHQDGLVDDVATRKLAIVVQLSDPRSYHGGDLELFDVVADSSPEELAEWHAVVRTQGSATAFPAFEYHRVTPLVSGVRRSLVVWVSGPAFR